jgi:hypothetical protein
MSKFSTYDILSERLWEKLEYHRDKIILLDRKDINTDYLNGLYGLITKRFISANNLVKDLILETNNEFTNTLDAFQIAWAIKRFHTIELEYYNWVNEKDLRVRR